LRKSLFWPRLVRDNLHDANSDPDYCREGVAVTDFDIFLSHNSTDKALVESIAQKLQSKGLNPWLDKWCLVPGQPWQLQLATILRSCPTFGVFVGQNGLGDWAREELLVAQDRAARERSFRIIPILLPGLPDPFDYGKLPPFLAQRTWIDFRRGIEQPRPLLTLINAIKGFPPGPDIALAEGTEDCPYRGLAAFDEEHAEFFFGRERDIQRLLEKLKATRFVAVLGASGSGKSSLTRAGLIPALKQGALPQSANWAISVFTPGSQPLTTLAAHLVHVSPSQQIMQRTLDHLIEDQRTLYLAVAVSLVNKKTSRIVLVVDQFEEVFTLCKDERERAQFLANLVYASSVPDGQCMVLITMRADFLPKCAGFPDLAARVAAEQFFVTPMDADMLRQAIEEPARRVGLCFEPGVVDNILKDVANQPGALPLLEHALLELWKRRQGRTLTLDGYRESGGVTGAIAKTAEETFNSFKPDEQRIVRRIMLRLTQLGEGTEDTRRRASIDELATAPEEADVVERIVRAMVDAHLLTASGA
jgi:energy-coupling factor transporter ATP-binding protein EcfA2